MNVLRRTPLSVGLVTALLTTSALKRRPRFRDGRLEDRVSTNLNNLRAAPVRSLAGSAIVLEDGDWLVPTVIAGLTVAALEYRVGTRRTAGIAIAGHVVPTLLTQAGVWWALRRGWLPESERSRRDTGASYVAAAAVGAIATSLPDRARWIVGGTAAAAAVVDVVTSRDIVETGHLLALGVGAAVGTRMAAF
jgi:rhomboid family protein